MIEGRQNTREKSRFYLSLLSWGMTNRNFQELLRKYSTIPVNKTAWSKFCRNYKNNFRNLPARLDTELSCVSYHNAC